MSELNSRTPEDACRVRGNNSQDERCRERDREGLRLQFGHRFSGDSLVHRADRHGCCCSRGED